MRKIRTEGGTDAFEADTLVLEVLRKLFLRKASASMIKRFNEPLQNRDLKDVTPCRMVVPCRACYMCCVLCTAFLIQVFVFMQLSKGVLLLQNDVFFSDLFILFYGVVRTE